MYVSCISADAGRSRTAALPPVVATASIMFRVGITLPGVATARPPTRRMGRKSKPALAAPTSIPNDAEGRLQMALDLKKQGNERFARREFAKALQLYDAALRLVPEDKKKESAVLHNNKVGRPPPAPPPARPSCAFRAGERAATPPSRVSQAACHLKALRFKDTIRECSNALALDPELGKALARRARALEMSGNAQAALEDYKRLVEMPGMSTPENAKKVEALEQAVKEGRGVTKLAARSQQEQEAQRRAQQKRTVQEIKLTLGEETRVVRFTAGEATYAALAEQVRRWGRGGRRPGAGAMRCGAPPGCVVGPRHKRRWMRRLPTRGPRRPAQVPLKFPGVKAARLKYKDRQGETVTVSSRDDVQAALEVALVAALEQGTPRLGALPPAKMVVEPCEEGEAPAPPAEETKQLESMRQMRKYIEELQEKQLKARMEQLNQQATAGAELVEIDSWVVQFAQLFREHLGIDPDRHVDLQQEGWDKVGQALDKTLASDEAVGLLEQGIDKFKEVIALGHLNWGHAYSAIARKHMEDMARAGVGRAQAEGNEHYRKALEEFARAEGKMKEAFEYRPEFYDGAVGMGQLWFERAKLEAGMLLTNPATTPEAAEGTSKQDEEKAYKACLARVDSKHAASAMPLFERAIEWHDKGIAFAKGAVGGTDPQKVEVSLCRWLAARAARAEPRGTSGGA